VTVRDGKAGLPYSKGLMATSIMASGLPPGRAHHVAEVIENKLHEQGSDSISSTDLRELAARVLEDVVGTRYADNYRTWQRAQDRTRPLIVLLGGATGVGKSTVATTVAARLGIVRFMSSDAIREVMRGIFTREMMPSLHASSFDVAEHLREPTSGDANPVLVGFRRQVGAVSVGISQMMRRAVVEGTDLLIEGAHLVPGFLQLPTRSEAIVAQMIVTVDDEQMHRSHFVARSQDTRAQRTQRNYLDYFGEIRLIQDYVRALAVEHGVPIVTSYSLDATVSRVMELVVSSLTGALDNPDPSPHHSAASAAPTPDVNVRDRDIVLPSSPQRP
jgi:2-phosphoglycerate kinase